uniref:Ovule protein n=1 Tax=Rodentolepis nana TaxID=102285 RepID=A0A0R3T6N9_RODNA
LPRFDSVLKHFLVTLFFLLLLFFYFSNIHPKTTVIVLHPCTSFSFWKIIYPKYVFLFGLQNVALFKTFNNSLVLLF